MSEETEALTDMGTDLEVDFLESLKKDAKESPRPTVPQNAATVAAAATIMDFSMMPSMAIGDIVDLLDNERKGDHTTLSLIAVLSKVKKLAEAKLKDLEEEGSREFELRMAQTDEKSIDVGIGNFKRNGVKNVWCYSPKVGELIKKEEAAKAAVKKQQSIEQVDGTATCVVEQPKKKFAVSV